MPRMLIARHSKVMQQMMNSKAMQTLLNNKDLLRSVVLSWKLNSFTPYALDGVRIHICFTFNDMTY